MGYRIDDKDANHCLECGDTITYGRKDKVFCCQKCKNRYNNRKMQRTRETRRRIHRILMDNYEILEGVLKMRIASIDLYDLGLLGFKPEYSTSYRKYGVRNEYHCYDIKYFMTPSRIFAIQREKGIMQAETDTAGSDDKMHYPAVLVKENIKKNPSQRGEGKSKKAEP